MKGRTTSNNLNLGVLQTALRINVSTEELMWIIQPKPRAHQVKFWCFKVNVKIVKDIIEDKMSKLGVGSGKSAKQFTDCVSQ